MVTVKLIRGPLAALTYEHPDKRSAMRRANALKVMHSETVTPLTESEDGQTIMVDASVYYAGADPKTAGQPRPSRRRQKEGAR